jgi:hypothetical protein
VIDKRLPFVFSGVEIAHVKNGKGYVRRYDYAYPNFTFYNERGKVIKRVSKEVLEYCKQWLVDNGPDMGHGYSREEIKEMMETSVIKGARS